MATYPQPNGPCETYCVRDQLVSVWFKPNGGSDPASRASGGCGGPFVTGVARTAAGLYTVTMVGLVPKVLIGAYVYGFDNANADDTLCTIGAVTITSATKTVTVRIGTRTAAGVAKDIAANAASIVKIGLHFKVYPGADSTGL